MRIVVIGASGPTGQRLVDQALAGGHQVTGVARRPLTARPGLTAISADIMTTPVDLTGADAIISVLGVPVSRKPVSVYSRGVDAILAAGAKRLLVVSSSVLDPHWRPSNAFFFNHVLDPYVNRVLVRHAHDDMRRMEAAVRSSGTDWTIVRPSGLFNTDAVTDYLVAPQSADGVYTSRADLAASLLREAADNHYVGREMGVVTTAVKPNLLQMLRGTPVAVTAVR